MASLREPWLFGPMSRQEAEDIIRQHKGADGLFLVRQSSSVPGAYALTCSFDVSTRRAEERREDKEEGEEGRDGEEVYISRMTLFGNENGKRATPPLAIKPHLTRLSLLLSPSLCSVFSLIATQGMIFHHLVVVAPGGTCTMNDMAVEGCHTLQDVIKVKELFEWRSGEAHRGEGKEKRGKKDTI